MQYSATYLSMQKQNFCCIHNKHGVGMKLIMKQAHSARWQQLIEHLKEYLLFVLSMRSSSKQNLQNKTKLTPLKYKMEN